MIWRRAVHRSKTFSMASITRAAPIVIMVTILLAGCKEGWTERGLPKDTVLLDSAAIIGPHSPPIRLNPPLKPHGEVLVCLVLASGIRYDDRARVDAKYAEMLQGARPTALLLHAGGNSYRLSEAHQNWTDYGRVSSGGELSSCLTTKAEALPEGVEINSIELTSDIPLKVLGVYWSSTEPL